MLGRVVNRMRQLLALSRRARFRWRSARMEDIDPALRRDLGLQQPPRADANPVGSTSTRHTGLEELTRR